MGLTREEVRHVAKLAALELSPEELVRIECQLNDILEYIDQLKNIPTVGVPATSHVHGAVNFFREDIVRESLPRDALEQVSPAFENGSFLVPKII